MFLVKWAGLGYEHCTWETQEDINDDAIIAEFRRLEGVTPEEPELVEEDVQKIIDSAITVTNENAGGNPDMAFLRSQLYAQTRSFHFTKFGADIPSRLKSECGPNSLSFENGSVSSMNLPPQEVKSSVNDMVHRVSLNKRDFGYSQHVASLPPILQDEYDVALPVTSKGLLLNVGEQEGSVKFLGYRQLPNDVKGPSELASLVHNVGDQIIAVNGRSAVGKGFADVIGMLKETVTFAYIRFLSFTNKYPDLSSCGKYGESFKKKACFALIQLVVYGSLIHSLLNTGGFLYDDITTRCKEDRRRLLAKRALAMEAEDDSSTSSEELPDDSDNDSDDSQSASDLEPDSEDEGMAKRGRNKKYSVDDDDSDFSGGDKPNSTENDKEEEKESSDAKGVSLTVTHKQETTRSLAFELLDMDVGYSSDEGGDEDNAHYVSYHTCIPFNLSVLIIHGHKCELFDSLTASMQHSLHFRCHL